MLTIQSCNPTGFFSYGLHETVPLDAQGVVLLTGINHDRLNVTANAAGKSSLLNTVVHVLYGQNPTEKGEDKIVNEVWGRGCWGMVKFCIDNRQYRIILTRSWKGPYPDESVENEPSQLHIEGCRYEGTNLYFDVFDGQRWADLRKTRVAETRVLVGSIIGISYDRFLATSYLAQQKGLAFIGGKNKDRMELITELTDMKIWDACVLEAKARLKAGEGKIEAAKRDVATWTTKADTLGVASLPDVEGTRHERDRMLAENDVLFTVINVKSRELAEASNKRIEISQHIKDADAITDSISREIVEIQRRISNEDAVLMGLAIARQQPIKDPNYENGNTTKVHEYMNMKWGIERRLQGMLPGAGKCDKCGSHVTDESLHIEKAALVVDLQAIENALEVLQIEMKVINDAAQEAHLANIDLKIKVSGDAKDGLLAQLDKANESMTEAKKITMALMATDIEWNTTATKIQIELLDAKKTMESNVRALTAIAQALDRDDDIKRQITEARHEAGAAQTALDLMLESARYYEAIVKGMGDKGVKAHKFGAMIQVLNDLIADNMRVLTDGQVQVWFSPWREKANAKNSDDIVPEIQIFVKEGPKEQVELALYSGMERQQIVIAIIRAFNKLALLNGAGTNLLFMDEMFGMFDEASASTAIKLMNQLKNSDWGTIVVVTHNPDIKQAIAYDQLWTAEKRNHITTLKRETK